jgi:cell division GTPase FtsZ
MNVGIIGFGNAGSKITNRILEFEYDSDRTFCQSALAINSARADLTRIDRIPERNRVLIGQTDERVQGHGVGSNPELGAEIARADKQELKRALDDVSIHSIDAFLIVAGLGGGTGSGGAPVLAETMCEMYDEPVYGLAILPSKEEGGRASLNAGRTLPSFVGATDNTIVFDNETWRRGTESLQAGYTEMNEEIVKRIVSLMSAGAIDGSQVSENVMDSSDIRRTFATGGVSTIAYAEMGLSESTRRQKGLLGRLRTNQTNGDKSEADAATKIKGIVRQATKSRLTCPANISTAERSLIVLSGPPEELSRKGLEAAREWLEDRTGSVEVLAGDDPRKDADHLSATVLLSNVTGVERIEQLQQQAVDAKANIESQAADREQEIEALITDDNNELDPI